jgi:hypothetical protein
MNARYPEFNTKFEELYDNIVLAVPDDWPYNVAFVVIVPDVFSTLTTLVDVLKLNTKPENVVFDELVP